MTENKPKPKTPDNSWIAGDPDLVSEIQKGKTGTSTWSTGDVLLQKPRALGNGDEREG